MENWIKYGFYFAVLAIFQSLIFSNIHFGGMVNAFPYVYFILILPFTVNGRQILLLSALMGLTIDFMMASLGVHMMAMVTMGYTRIHLLPALAPSGDYEVGTTPSVRDNGWTWFLRYTIPLVTLHHLVLFITESSSWSHLGNTLWSALLSTGFTLFIIILFQLAIKKQIS